jgi:hypothetical protein
MQSYNKQEASDPWDKIFSLLNTLRAFASSDEKTAWALSFTNYDLDTRSVLLAAATHIVESRQGKVLSVTHRDAHHTFDFSAQMFYEGVDLPSWVPKWDATDAHSLSYDGRSIRELSTLIPYSATVSGDILETDGHIVDSVSSDTRLRSSSNTDTMMDEVELYWKHIEGTERAPSATVAQMAFSTHSGGRPSPIMSSAPESDQI